MNKVILIIILLLSQTIFSQTWVQKLSGSSFISITKDILGNVYAGCTGTPRNLYKTSDQGVTWDTLIVNAPSNFLYISVDSLGVIYAANLSNGLMRSSNAGINWTNTPVSTFGGSNVTSVNCGKNGWVFVGVISGGLYKSTDNGTTFTQTTLTGMNIVSILVDRINPNFIYAGSSSTGTNGFYRSTDGGATWSSNLNPRNCYFMMQKPNNNLYIAVTSAPYTLEKSTNLGLNWSSLHTFAGANRGICHDIAGNIYTAGNGGVWKSTDDGISFINHGLTYSSNQIVSIGNKIMVAVTGTTNGGVWIYTDTTLTGIKSDNSIANKYVLEQNYPNPFNPRTTMRFTLKPEVKSEKTKVKLVIYDVLGKEVETLVNKELQPGEYEMTWDGNKYQSGIYFYKLITETFSETRKMILIK